MLKHTLAGCGMIRYGTDIHRALGVYTACLLHGSWCNPEHIAAQKLLARVLLKASVCSSSHQSWSVCLLTDESRCSRGLPVTWLQAMLE